MVLRFGKTVDWTSRNTAIGRISLDDENLYKLCIFSWLWFLLFFSNDLEQYLHTQCSWGLNFHYKPSTLTEVSDLYFKRYYSKHIEKAKIPNVPCLDLEHCICFSL